MATAKKVCNKRPAEKRHTFDACAGCVSALMLTIKGRLNESSSAHFSNDQAYGFGVYGTGGKMGIFLPMEGSGTDALESIRAAARSVIAVCDNIENRGERPVKVKDPLAGVGIQNRPRDLAYDSDIDG